MTKFCIVSICIYLTEIRLSKIYESDNKIKHKLYMPLTIQKFTNKYWEGRGDSILAFSTKLKLAATICVEYHRYSIH